MKTTKKMPPSKNAPGSIFRRLGNMLYALFNKNSTEAKLTAKKQYSQKDKATKKVEDKINALEVEKNVIMREYVLEILRVYISKFVTSDISTKYMDGGGLELSSFIVNELKAVERAYDFESLPLSTRIFLGGVIKEKTDVYKNLLAKFGNKD